MQEPQGGLALKEARMAKFHRQHRVHRRKYLRPGTCCSLVFADIHDSFTSASMPKRDGQ
jgi:hypothetical protein